MTKLSKDEAAELLSQMRTRREELAEKERALFEFLVLEQHLLTQVEAAKLLGYGRTKIQA